MGRYELDAIYKPVELLREKHDVPTAPNRSLRPMSQSWQRVFVEQKLPDENQRSNDHTRSEQAEHTGDRCHTEGPRLPTGQIAVDTRIYSLARFYAGQTAIPSVIKCQLIIV